MELGGVTADLTLAQLLKRPELSYERLCAMLGEPGITDREIVESIEITVKYDGYIQRQLQQVARFKKLEERQIPAAFNYDRVIGFSREVQEKLKQVRPASIGQASRISGVTPAAVSLLLVALERDRRQAHAHVVASRSTMQ
jgi:tRNA uridine 5-carboxymethylaminomethyl modification enzyme